MMASKVVPQMVKCRKKFELTGQSGKRVDMIRWFPRHMFSSLQKMQARLRSVDCVIEVHDARIPFSGRNLHFRNTLYAIRPHVLVMNKADLVDPSYYAPLEAKLKSEDPHLKHVFWAAMRYNAYDACHLIRDTIVKEMTSTARFHRTEVQDYAVMVIGIPNVGKSTVINALRNEFLKQKSATRVGDKPGVTKSVMERIRVNDTPPIYVLDTPGILAPKAENIETGLKMGLCHVVFDHLIGMVNLADFLLYWCNKHGHMEYVKELGLTEPSDEILKVLIHTAITQEMFSVVPSPDGSKKVQPDINGAATHFVYKYRRGDLGKWILDDL